MSKIYCCLVLASLVFMSGCVQTRYAWDNYDQKLYNHYKSPEDQGKFVEELKKIITKNETDGRIPPGIFAEYGYALYEQGEYPEAIEYFKKEQARWPESNILMAKMINNSEGRMKQKQEGPLAVNTEKAEGVQ